jgi:Protein of unknown function (DUF938)
MPPTLQKCCPLFCGSLQTPIHARLRVSPRIERGLMLRTCGRHTAQSNEDFDAWLRTQNAQWGVRDIAEVTDLAHRHGFFLAETIPMPANNLSVIFERGP